MKEMTDRELTDKISQVFENFEDPDAAKGWQELRKKYPENNTRPLIFWWGAAAAVILVISGLWFFIPDTTEGTGELAISKSNKQKEIPKSNTQSDYLIRNEAEKRSRISSPSDEPDFVGEASPYKRTYPKSLVASKSSPAIKPTITTSGGSTRNEQFSPRSAVNAQPIIQENADRVVSISLPDQVQLLSAINDMSTKRDSVIEITAKLLAMAQENPEQDLHLHAVEKVPYSSKKVSSEKNTISFYAGSYFNYSLGSETELNFGAGFTSDIKLSGNLRLSTGLALANNSLRYNDGVPSSSKQKLAFDALPSFGSAITGSANNNLTTITRYDASLLALDIPVNLKYLIIPRDNKLYLLAGLSSGTYIDETYSLNYRNYSASGAYVNQPQAIEVKKQLQTFDIARTLNISFGYSSNLGKTQNITIEPFLKYPLSGLGSEDLKFGSAGINLKLNFSQLKK
jgi:hypothetical protein